MKPQIIAQGAEATITLNKNIITKNRLPKSYRIPELDDKIRRQRTKKEIKLLTKASSIINCPLPSVGRAGTLKIIMPFIDGKKLSQHLNEFPLTKQKQILKQIGQDVAKLHKENIIHGDLTTSNMILVEKNNSASQKDKIIVNNKITANESEQLIMVSGQGRGGFPKVYFIDFGLGFISRKIEDKAVDIHLLKQALEAKHFEHWETLFKEFFKGYKKDYPESKKVLERLNAVEKRGRYKS